MDNIKTIQRNLFKRIIQMRGGSKDFVEELGALLNLKKSASNNRIRGATKLSLTELITIAQKYRISIDPFIDSKYHPISFTCDAIRKMPTDIDDYLINIAKHFKQITQAKNINFTYFADEVPIFHFMQFPVLFYFKLFVWNYMSWKIPDYLDGFSIDQFEKKERLSGIMDQLSHTYYEYPGIEIWNVRMLDLSLDQLKYFIISGAIRDKNDAIAIFQAIKDLCQHLEMIAQRGAKFMPNDQDNLLGDTSVFLNEIKKGTDIILVKSDHFKIVYSTFDSPNFIKTQNNRFIEHTQEVIDKVTQSSSDISGKGEKDRKNVFMRIRKKVLSAEKEINGLLDFIY